MAAARTRKGGQVVSRAVILQDIARANRQRRCVQPTHGLDDVESEKKSIDAPTDLLASCVQKFIDNGMPTETCRDVSQVPGAVYALMRSLAPAANALRIAPDMKLKQLDWSALTQINVRCGIFTDDDTVTVSHAAGAIADHGALVLASSQECPTTLAFLPDIHLVVVNAGDIAATLQHALSKFSSSSGRDMPRAINIIAGASRTADIGGKIVQGAHGPHTVGTVIYDAE